mmetsp:Transcript_11861/g.43364  ORF Transcript_11861/g.43364 Transcript_11861/m.43364 type:complete len:690 (-) Transcript_11861:81-2150(-)
MRPFSGLLLLAWPVRPKGWIDSLDTVPTAPLYVACSSGYYGYDCGGICRCSPADDCLDGLTGDGTCICPPGPADRCSKTSVPSYVYTPVIHGQAGGAGCRRHGVYDEVAACTPTSHKHEDTAWFPLSFQPASLLQYTTLDSCTRRGQRQVVDSFISLAIPTPLQERLAVAAFSASVARLLLGNGIDEQALLHHEHFARVFSGSALLEGTLPIAYNYGGHQFGSWSGQLGDGRVISLGDIQVYPSAERWEVSLKGAGKTPYSRAGDGRAVLRSSIREFLASEAMSGLGIPTARSLSVVTSNDTVHRDMFYNGNVIGESAAVTARVAKAGAWMRIGTLELPAKRGDLSALREITNAAMDMLYPYLSTIVVSGHQERPSKYAAFLYEVAWKTAELLSSWMVVGFIHGVLNTDNMSLAGVTIDYAAFAFMEYYDPSFVPNTTDDEGRYAYIEQPKVARWNLERLASALKAVGVTEEEKEIMLQTYDEAYEALFYKKMARKLGLVVDDLHVHCSISDRSCDRAGTSDKALRGVVDQYLSLLQRGHVDFTRSFYTLLKGLTCSPEPHVSPREIINGMKEISDSNYLHAWEDLEPFWSEWLVDYERLLSGSEEGYCSARCIQRLRQMQSSNPTIVLRNYLAHEAIEAAKQGDFSQTQTLLEALENPYNQDHNHGPYVAPAPQWAMHRGIRELSCSS